MSDQVSIYLSPAQRQIVERGKALGLGRGPGTVLQSLAAFALFRFEGPSEAMVAASSELESHVAALRAHTTLLRQQALALASTLDAAYTAMAAADAAHTRLRAEVEAIAHCAALTTPQPTGATP